MNTFICQIIVLSIIASCGDVNSNTRINQTTTAEGSADTCDDPDANINCCFINMPARLNSVMTIAGPNENGEKLVVSGTILKADGKTPYPGVLLYAYHTDSKGYYSKSGKETGAQKWHGRLHGWCKTDAKGFYEIRSVRPAPYPSNTIPAHIHIAVKEPVNKEPYYITDIVFKDDKLVNEQYLKSITSMVGGTGVVEVTKSQNGAWIGKRNILLTE